MMQEKGKKIVGKLMILNDLMKDTFEILMIKMLLNKLNIQDYINNIIHVMNFLSFLTSGASLFNFKLQSSATASKLPSLQLDGLKQFKTCEEKQKNLDTSGEKLENLENSEPTQKNLSEVILTQQQQLINQYMHLNLQLMNQKIQALRDLKNDKIENYAEEHQHETLKNMKKKIKKINKCGHQDKQHYAKGMCNNCYHKYGRTKKPWNCPHQKLYAVGMCQNCYINSYNKKKREEKCDRFQEESEEKQIEKERTEEKIYKGQQENQQECN